LVENRRLIDFIVFKNHAAALLANAGAHYAVDFKTQETDFAPINQVRFELVVPIWVFHRCRANC